jgi:hypothetical protein
LFNQPKDFFDGLLTVKENPKPQVWLSDLLRFHAEKLRRRRGWKNLGLREAYAGALAIGLKDVPN